MHRRIAAVVTLASTTFAITIASEGCSHRDPLNQLADEAGTPSFAEDASSGANAVDAGLLDYCPTTSCPSPFTTCPGSRFQCDVNLMTDPQNCGSCGFVCQNGAGGATFDCISGTCVMKCRTDSHTADCNGILDDDCEVTLGTNENCNACGDRCLDPDKPCVFDQETGHGTCGCDAGKIFCNGDCVDPQTDDQNCSTCGIDCPREGDGSPLADHTYFGCGKAECGHVKCENGWNDCDGKSDNGCETSLMSETDCGSCGHACDPGQSCRPNNKQEPTCMCPAGMTLCGNNCVDLGLDPKNCGGCGIDCTYAAANQNGLGICSFGSCKFACSDGWGDCNGDPKDGCEVRLTADPRNCGACGASCDLVMGQPCVLGRCAVEACGDGGGPTR